ncbi:hypothetical protein PybrP1_011946 [[Pythium] brassicae (nom. inval.)]|nr:hypothetical protein PybrP1_011946 [[Pythium] brassicae (nom. inval.)]
METAESTAPLAVESCQICFEHVPAAQFIVGSLCSPLCPARVCHTCLIGHLRASLDGCYAGVLPRVRCPICLTRLNKTHWSALADAAAPELAERYAAFCKTACSLQAPCCHKVGYSHLPDLDPKSELVAVDSVLPLTSEKRQEQQTSPADSDTPTPTTSADADAAAAAAAADTASEDALRLEFLERCREFSFHRQESRAVVQFALDAFQDPVRAAAVVEAALTRIIDDERRATLLLSFLYLRPAATTRCCKRAFCFNCKRNGHHDTCDTEEIQIASCVARCRSCRVMIVKVEGCNSVTCVCGFTMGWAHELKLFQEKLERRRKRVLVRQYLPMLRRRLGRYVWWFRANRYRQQLQREVFWA